MSKKSLNDILDECCEIRREHWKESVYPKLKSDLKNCSHMEVAQTRCRNKLQKIQEEEGRKSIEEQFDIILTQAIIGERKYLEIDNFFWDVVQNAAALPDDITVFKVSNLFKEFGSPKDSEIIQEYALEKREKKQESTAVISILSNLQNTKRFIRTLDTIEEGFTEGEPREIEDCHVMQLALEFKILPSKIYSTLGHSPLARSWLREKAVALQEMEFGDLELYDASYQDALKASSQDESKSAENERISLAGATTILTDGYLKSLTFGEETPIPTSLDGKGPKKFGAEKRRTQGKKPKKKDTWTPER